MDNQVLWAGLKAFMVAVVLTPIMRDVFRSYNIVDRPGVRKIHAHPIPRIGGVGIAVAYGLSLLSFSQQGASLTSDGLPIAGIVPGALMIFLTGLLDDFFNLRPVVKLCGQIVAAALVFWQGLRIQTIANLELPWWLSLPLTIFWLVLITNAFNLIDGLDGLCAGVGLVATLAMSGAAVLHGNQQLLQATLPLAGALVGFLVFNSNPATVFLGDSGALLIGFLLGCYGMVWTQKTATVIAMVVPLMVLSVPLMDTSMTILRRFLRNAPIFGADRGHIHHQLLDRGLSPRKAVLVLYTGAGTAAALAILLSASIGQGYQNLVIVGALGLIWLAVRQLRLYGMFGKRGIAGDVSAPGEEPAPDNDAGGGHAEL